MIKTINNLTKEEALELAFKIGFESEASKTNCAQATFHSISTVLGIKNPEIFKCMYSLAGGGAGSTCGSCGAFSGALVAFSLTCGRTYNEWKEGKKGAKASKLSDEFYKKFTSRFGTIICREIHQELFGRTFDFKNKNDIEEFEKLGAHIDKCPTVTGLSSSWAVEILWDEISGDTDLSGIISMDESQ
jgi:C_GCAxxG_C_C family probable redox protein